MPTFDVNTKEVIKYTAKLERLHKSAFPSAVRNTLNEAAFQDKVLIPKTANKKFITRSKSLFKAFTVTNKASGFNVNTMQSEVGLNPSKGSRVAHGLGKQETGGSLNGRKLIAHRDARIGRNKNKKVAARNRFSKGNIHNATNSYRNGRGGKKSRFVSAVMSTAKSGSTRMLLTSGNKGMVYDIGHISSSRKTKRIKFKLKKLYSYRSNPNTKVKPVGYMKESANVIQKRIPNIYKEKFEFQIKKHMK